jgi:hypothetical protein
MLLFKWIKRRQKKKLYKLASIRILYLTINRILIKMKYKNGIQAMHH